MKKKENNETNNTLKNTIFELLSDYKDIKKQFNELQNKTTETKQDISFDSKLNKENNLEALRNPNNVCLEFNSNGCYKKNCIKKHLYLGKDGKIILCKYNENCYKQNCYYLHVSNINIEKKKIHNTSNNNNNNNDYINNNNDNHYNQKKCKYGFHCKKKNICKYLHPKTNNFNNSNISNNNNKFFNKKKCKYGINCNKKQTCNFWHPKQYSNNSSKNYQNNNINNNNNNIPNSNQIQPLQYNFFLIIQYHKQIIIIY